MDLFNRRAVSLAVTVVVIAVSLVVGASMIPVITSVANGSAYNVTAGEITSAQKTLIDLVPTIFILILVVGGAMELVGRVRD